MIVSIQLNGKKIVDDISPDMTLYKFVREHGCYSVKCGCETTNCGLCTVFFDGKPILSCAMLAVRIDGCHVTTLEGLQDEAKEFALYMGREGADQCGFCNPGFVMNVLAMVRKLDAPTEDDIKEFLSGNLCRCTGYVSHMRAIKAYFKAKGKEVRA